MSEKIILLRKVILLFFLSIFGFTFDLQASTYWVAFSGVNSLETQYYLMQIDSHGDLTSGPNLVWKRKSFGPTLSINSRNTGTLNLWTSRSGWNNNIVRAVIDKTTSKLVDVRKTDLRTSSYPSLQVTQRREGNFLVFPSGHFEYFGGVKLTPKGAATSEKWILLQNTAGRLYPANGLSSDGRVFVYCTFRDLFLQRLRKSGRPNGEPGVVQHTADRYFNGFSGADISHILSDGKRFLTYIASRRSQHDEAPDRLYLKIIDARSLQPSGKPILLHSSSEWGDDEGGLTSVAIDPSGDFLLYVEDESILKFQSIDPGGHPTGDPITLVDTRYTFSRKILDLDILKQ